MLNLPHDNKSEKFPHKVCNSINCYFSNEKFGDIDISNSQSGAESCLFCSYNHNNLYEKRNLIKYELSKRKSGVKNIVKRNMYNFFVLSFLFLVAVLCGVYFFLKFRFFIK